MAKFTEIFDYNAAAEMPTGPQPTLIYGRKDPLLAQAMGELYEADLVTEFMISGGFGKDSGDLWASRIGESDYIKNIAVDEYGIDPDRIQTEQKALVGSENARFGLRILREKGLLLDGEVTTLAHATSLRRLAATAVREAQRLGLDIPTFYKVPTAYAFDPTNPKDRNEAANELLRVVDWGASGLIAAQTELPDADLIEFARTNPDTGGRRETPAYPNALRLAILRRLPHDLRRRAMHG